MEKQQHEQSSIRIMIAKMEQKQQEQAQNLAQGDYESFYWPFPNDTNQNAW